MLSEASVPSHRLQTSLMARGARNGSCGGADVTLQQRVDYLFSASRLAVWMYASVALKATRFG